MKNQGMYYVSFLINLLYHETSDAFHVMTFLQRLMKTSIRNVKQNLLEMWNKQMKLLDDGTLFLK